MDKLKFGKGNAKLGKNIHHMSVLSGWACPAAKLCKSRATINSEGKKKIEDGPDTEFRCFSASQEVLYPAVYAQRLANFNMLRQLRGKNMVLLINRSLPTDAKVVRIHVGGDFFSQRYFDAWMAVAELNPNILFYAYTKSLNFWIKRKDTIPKNMKLTASRGGKFDHLITQHGLKEAVVVFSKEQAATLGLEIDKDDTHAFLDKYDNKSFGLLIHGSQPAGSDAGKALSKLKKT